MTRIRSLSMVTLLAGSLFAFACTSESEAPPPETAGTDLAGAAPAESATPRMEDGVQVVEIEAGLNGYEPARIELQAGTPARLVFTRTVDSACSEHVTIPAFEVERTALPLNEPVAIEITPTEGGEFAFVCGMDMQEGTILVAS